MQHKQTDGFTFTLTALDELYDKHSSIFANPFQTGPARWNSAYNVLDDSVEDKSANNNTNFMTYLYEEHGYHKYKFFINGNVLFVGLIDSDNKKQIITTLISEIPQSTISSRPAAQQQNQKFNKATRSKQRSAKPVYEE